MLSSINLSKKLSRFIIIFLMIILSKYGFTEDINKLKIKSEQLEKEGKYFEALKLNELILEKIKENKDVKIKQIQSNIKTDTAVISNFKKKKSETKTISKIKNSNENRKIEKKIKNEPAAANKKSFDIVIGDYIKLSKDVHLKESPSDSAKTGGIINSNSIVSVISIKNEWIKIQRFDITGWINLKNFEVQKVEY